MNKLFLSFGSSSLGRLSIRLGVTMTSFLHLHYSPIAHSLHLTSSVLLALVSAMENINFNKASTVYCDLSVTVAMPKWLKLRAQTTQRPQTEALKPLSHFSQIELVGLGGGGYQ